MLPPAVTQHFLLIIIFYTIEYQKTNLTALGYTYAAIFMNQRLFLMINIFIKAVMVVIMT